MDNEKVPLMLRKSTLSFISERGSLGVNVNLSSFCNYKNKWLVRFRSNELIMINLQAVAVATKGMNESRGLNMKSGQCKSITHWVKQAHCVSPRKYWYHTGEKALTNQTTTSSRIFLAGAVLPVSLSKLDWSNLEHTLVHSHTPWANERSCLAHNVLGLTPK